MLDLMATIDFTQYFFDNLHEINKETWNMLQDITNELLCEGYQYAFTKGEVYIEGSVYIVEDLQSDFARRINF